MTLSRRSPEPTFFVTRCTTQGQYLLRPDAETNAVLAYALAEAAHRFRIDVVAFAAMPNHYRGVFRGHLERLGPFVARFHREVTFAMNRLRRRRENLFVSRDTSIHRLATPDDVFETCVDTLACPVAAELVARVADWPGVTTLPLLDGAVHVVRRPATFSAKGKLAAAVPWKVAGAPCGGFAPRLRDALGEREARLGDARIASGRTVLGRAAVLAMSTDAAPPRPPKPPLPSLAVPTRIATVGRHTAANA